MVDRPTLSYTIMKMPRRTIFLLTVVLLAASSPVRSQSPIIAPGATLQLIDSTYSFTEGPAVDADGNVFFTDQPNNRILKWSTDGTLSVFMEDAGRANGLFFDREGNLLACADLENQIWSISPDKKVTVLVNDFEGKRLNGPNDLWVDPKGGVYFTDPFYMRDYWQHTEKEIEQERVYYLSPDRNTVTIVADDLVQPNGIVGTADGATLFVADIRDRKTYRYDIGENGALTNKSLFVEMGSDGITLDSEGNLYLTGRGVTVFDKNGEQIEHIPIEQRWTANVTFGGKDRTTLFITAMGSVYTLAMRVKGL